MPKSNREFKTSLIDNKQSFYFYVDRLIELSVAVFDWKGLPDSCDARYIETTLFRTGSVAFFEEPDIGILSLPFNANGNFDVYGYPTTVQVYSRYNNFSETLFKPDFVPCYNNMLRKPSMQGAVYYAKRLWELDQIIDMNAEAQKSPILIQGTEKDRLTLLNLYKEYTGNAPAIFASNSLDPDSLKVLKTDAPYLADKLFELKDNIWNEALTYLGISNVSVEKKERLVTDEVMRSQGGTIASRFSRLNARKEACKKANEMFGLNISCDFRETSDDEADTERLTRNETEGSVNGEVYD